MKKSLSLFYEYSTKYKPRYRLHELRDWTYRGSKMVYPKVYLSPEVLEAIGTKPEEMLTSNRYDEEIKRETTINYDEFLNWKEPNLKKLLLKTDPNMDIERPLSLSFSQKNRFEFGDTQASLLTKTKIMDCDFPTLTEPQLPNDAKQILERFILKANWWITDENKFPKRYVQNNVIYNNKTEFGIQPKDTIRYMFNDLFYYSDYLSPSDELRIFNKGHFIETFYYWKNSRIQFSENRDFLISATQPLRVFRQNTVKWNPEELEVRMRPVDPRVDLLSIKHYPVKSCDGWRSLDIKSKYPHIITVNFDLPNIHTDFLEPEARQITQSQKNSISMMNCFCQAVATARRLFGDELVDNCEERLPYPICVQAIGFDGVQFDFIFYQLNSTNFNDNNVANLVWIDSENKFYDKIYRPRSMLRNTRYENLNLNVFRKFLSFYRYGCS